MVAVTEGLATLQAHSGSIALLAVVGPYHSGKSFLLNSLLRDPHAFSIGRRTSPETMGIWLCRTNLTASDGSEVWLMDSEGFFGPGVDETYDAKVFTVASLLGAHLLYNSVKIIDQQAVSLLEVLMQRAQLFRSRSSVRAEGRVPEFLLTESFPPLTWVVEDFVQELPRQFQQEGATGWLTTYLSESSSVDSKSKARSAGRNESAENFITKVFRDVRVHTLFLPATLKEQLRDLSQLSWEELTDDYRSEVSVLKRHLLQNLKARRLHGRAVTGPAMASALHFIIQALQQGMFQELPSLWASWTGQVTEMALSDAESWFKALLEEVDAGEAPVTIATFNGRVEQSREKAVSFYRHLLNDFGLWPQLGELRLRMDRHFEQACQVHGERVRRWVSELLTRTKDSFAIFLMGLTLPVDPAELERMGKAMSDKLLQNATAVLKTFAAPGPRTSLGTRAQMPTFSQEPLTLLAADIRAQLNARILENDREVSNIYKAAAQAADEVVEHELRSGSSEDSLLNRAQLLQLQRSAVQACWKAFDAKLAPLSWGKTAPEYKVQRAWVQKESLDTRIARLVASNEQRLQTFLQTGLHSVLTVYRERRQAVPMPATPAEVEAAHKGLAAAAQQQLEEHARAIIDTDKFKEAMKVLSAEMSLGRNEMLEKNVELWKVYANEATRCASIANHNVERQCGLLCFFKNVPWTHKATSRRHFTECLGKDTVGQRMSKELQTQVFEVWYRKDLGQTAERVATRFRMILGTLLVTVACGLGLWHCRRRPTAPPYSGFVYQPQRPWGTYPAQPQPFGAAAYQQAGFQAPQAAPPVAPMPTGPPGRRTYGLYRRGP